MRREWTAMSALLWACAGGQVVQPQAAHEAASGPGPSEKAALADAAAKAKTITAEPAACVASNTAPKVVTGESSASDSADTGVALVFEVAGIALEFPACTPETDVRVITTSWETRARPSASRIHPKFTRHAATLRVDQTIAAVESAPIQVRLRSKRELSKLGEKLVLAVESSGECDAQHRRDKLEDGSCSHWELFDTSFDAGNQQMVAKIPATGGLRLQFGWVPSK